MKLTYSLTFQKVQYNKKLIKVIKNKNINNNVTLTRADKGNCVVILNTVDYKSKILQFIEQNNIKQVKINNNN